VFTKSFSGNSNFLRVLYLVSRDRGPKFPSNAVRAMKIAGTLKRKEAKSNLV